MASCFLGALPPVLLRAVCFVRAISNCFDIYVSVGLFGWIEVCSNLDGRRLYLPSKGRDGNPIN